MAEEEKKSFCDAKDPDILSMLAEKTKMKDLLSGDLGNAEDVAKAQEGMKKGFDLLAGKSIGPVEYCVCSNYIEDFIEDPEYDEITGLIKQPSSKEACEAAGGTWTCKTIENFNLRDQMAELGSLTDPNAFSAKVAEVKEQFGELVTDLNDKVAEVNPKLGEFFKDFKLPPLPKAGDTVEQCVCVGGDPLASDKATCEDSGGTWQCKTVTLESDVGDFGGLIEGGVGKVTSFFSGAVKDATSAIQQSNGSINFGENNTLQIPSLSDITSKIPKPGEIVDICNCVGGDPLASGKEECIASGGEWVCKKGPAPDLSNLFGPTGLPKFSAADVCSKIEKIEVKTVLKTDPVTNKQSIENIAETAPEKPVIPKEPPKAPEPMPIVGTGSRGEYLHASIYTWLGLNRMYKKSKGHLVEAGYTKGEVKRIMMILPYAWRATMHELIGEDLDTASQYFGWDGPHPLKYDEVVEVYNEYLDVLRPAREPNAKPRTTKTYDEYQAKIKNYILTKYWTGSYADIEQQAPTYKGEAGLIKVLEMMKDEKLKEKAGNQANQAKLEEKKAEQPEEKALAADVAEISPPPTPSWLAGRGVVTVGWGPDTITYDQSEVYETSTHRNFYYVNGAESYQEMKIKGIKFTGYFQVEFDAKLTAIKTKQVTYFNNGRAKWAYKLNEKTNTLEEFGLGKVDGNVGRWPSAIWSKPAFKKKVQEWGIPTEELPPEARQYV